MDSADEALAALNGTALDGRPLTIRPARPQWKRGT
jgi:RNA recognition motif-containing protein